MAQVARRIGWEWVAKCRLLGGVPTLDLFDEAVATGSDAVPLMVDILSRRELREGEVVDGAQVPVHAMRVLGEVRELAALPALLGVITDPVDPALYGDEAGLALARIGEPALAPLIGVLFDRDNDTWVRVTAARALTFAALVDRRRRPRVLDAYEKLLTDHSERDRMLNAHVVGDACDLAAARLIPAVVTAFQEGRVDEDTIDGQSAVRELESRHQRPDPDVKALARRDVREGYVSWEDLLEGMPAPDRALFEESVARIDREGAAPPEPGDTPAYEDDKGGG